jgi:hypothetical protein
MGNSQQTNVAGPAGLILAHELLGGGVRVRLDLVLAPGA